MANELNSTLPRTRARLRCFYTYSGVANLLMFAVNKKKEVAFRPWFVIYEIFFIVCLCVSLFT